MRRVKTLFALKKLKQTSDLIYVSSIQKLYKCIDGEWFEQVNYTTKQISSIANVSQRQVQNIIRKLNIRPKIIKNDRLNYDQVAVIVRAVSIKKETPQKSYSEIKKLLNI